MQTLSRNAYGNYEVLDPQGNSLFFCQKKKFDWYLNRDLAIKISDSVSQLKFQPNGVGNRHDPCLLQKLKNKCVVCGSKEGLTRHHVVPYCYRIWMGRRLGRLNNFDVLPVCIPCHTAYELEATKLKNRFIENFKITHNGFIIDSELRKAKKVATALIFYKDKMPATKIKEYKEFIKDYLGKDWFTSTELYNLSEADPVTPTGKTAAEQIVDRTIDLDKFALVWRMHFLEYARPKYLPKNWHPEKRDARGNLKGCV